LNKITPSSFLKNIDFMAVWFETGFDSFPFKVGKQNLMLTFVEDKFQNARCKESFHKDRLNNLDPHVAISHN